MHDGRELRSGIDASIAVGNAPAADASLKELLSLEPGTAAAAFAVSRYERLRGLAAMTPYRLAILRSFTVEPLVPLLRAHAFAAGLDLAVHAGDFNAYAQEILDPSGPMYGFNPDAVILAVRTPDVAPELWRDAAVASPEQVRAAVARTVAHCTALVEALRRHTAAHLIVHTLELPAFASAGILDAQREDGQAAAIEDINRALRSLARAHRNVYLLDYDGLIARHGRLRWEDPAKWQAARLPIAPAHLADMSREWLRFLHPLSGRIAKALAMDLDNTLWGGVVGEDGPAGVRVGPEGPGAAYYSLQRALLDLRARGILLTICSKNNREDAVEALERHPGMLLRPSHFAATRIDWREKPVSLREIAGELNIGLDALAFLDDNPVERRLVRSELPEVTVLDLPADPFEYAAAVRNAPVFERLSLSAEDLRRSELYAAGRRRASLMHAFVSREDFYRSLEQEAEIAAVVPDTLARVAQLTQKTNQFHLTTRRYTEQQIAAMASDPACVVLSMRVRDRYGDSGVVGVAITRDAEEICEIDTFLLSCRVIGRTVESALLSRVAGLARARGMRFLRGWFYPTRKNAPAADFYARHGFELLATEEGNTFWSLDLERASVSCPEWVRVLPAPGAVP